MKDFIRTGTKCEQCSEDCWFIHVGFNRCACGQYLWIEKVRERTMIKGRWGVDTHFPYRQGRDLPKNWKGYAEVTR